MGKSSPRPPDPAQTIAASEAANRNAAQESLRLNSLDRFGPFGSATFNRDPSGLPTGQQVSLAPGLEGISQQAQNTGLNLSQFLPQGQFRIEDILGPNRLGAQGNLTGGGVADALIGNQGGQVPGVSPIAQNFFEQQQGLLAPGFARDLQGLDVQATNRGLPLGSEARNRLEEPLREAQNLALQNAAFGAVQLTPGEENRQVGLAELERNRGFQDVGSSLGLLGQIPGTDFAPQPSAGVAAPNVAGITQQGFQNELSITQQRNKAISDALGAVGALGGSFLGGPAGGMLAGRLLGGGSPTLTAGFPNVG